MTPGERAQEIVSAVFAGRDNGFPDRILVGAVTKEITAAVSEERERCKKVINETPLTEVDGEGMTLDQPTFDYFKLYEGTADCVRRTLIAALERGEET